MDAIFPILRSARTVEPHLLPDELIATTKRFILDTVGVMIAGTRAPGCEEVAAYACQWTGSPSATLITGRSAPAPYAALVNAVMAHAVEFDDTYEPADVHAYCVVLPAVLAVAEAEGSGISGLEMVAAVAKGVDIAYRMGSAIRTYRGWHPTATCGIIGATVAAGLVARLDEQRLHHAVGIAYSLAAGTFQPVVDPSLAKRLQPGFAARGAVEAVLLARAGLTGPRDVLQGVFGFFPLFEANEYDPKILTDGLGVQFLGAFASMKPYPCCRFNHGAIDAALAVAATIDVDGEAARRAAIADVEIAIPDETLDYVGRRFGSGPDRRIEAQFSVAYTVASALVRGHVTLQDFTGEAVGDPMLAEFARSIRIKGMPVGRYGPSTVRVEFATGAILERTTSQMKGEPGNGLSTGELLAKLRDCLRYAGWREGTADDLGNWAGRLDRSVAPLEELHAILRTGRSR